MRWLDEKFFINHGPISLKEVVSVTKGEIVHSSKRLEDNDLFFNRLVSLSEAENGDLSFIVDMRYKDLLQKTKASAVILYSDLIQYLPDYTLGILTKSPHTAMAKTLRLFGSVKEFPYSSSVPESCIIGDNCMIAPTAIIGESVRIGHTTIIAPNVVIGHGVEIGSNCYIGPLASVLYSYLGDHVTIHAGVRIGERGFGFSMDSEEDDPYTDIPHFGRVLVGNYVEIGANSTVSRGSLRDTIIGDGCKIDQLVTIGHNVHLGKKCVLAGQTGIAGSTILGDRVVCGGQVGIAEHLHIDNQTTILAKSGVSRSLHRGVYVGIPAVPYSDFIKKNSVLKKLTEQKK